MGLGNGVVGSPTALHQKIRAIGGIPTPFAASAASPMAQRSNPPTPTQTGNSCGGRPEFIGSSQQHGATGGAPQLSYPRPHNVPTYYDTSYNVQNGEQRRILSESELMYDRHQYMMPHDQSLGGGVGGGGNAGGPIRELASSPQRGVYMWKDNSPTSVGGVVNYFHSNPTSPIQHNLVNNGGNAGSNNRAYTMHPGVSHMSSYNPNQQMYGGPGSGPQQQVPLSPSKKMYGMGISSTVPNSISDGIRPSPISRRPMSFVRALEMTDSLEMANNSRTQPNTRSSPAGTPKGGNQGGNQSQNNDMSERSSIYDTNYEISV